MEKVPVTISVDSDIVDSAYKLFEDLGLDLSTACNMFLRQAVYEWKIPIFIHRDIPNEETIAAFEEAERMANDPSAKLYDSVEELFADLNSNDED